MSGGFSKKNVNLSFSIFCIKVKEDVYFVTLTKESGSGLGFSIAGGVDLEQKSITVSWVLKKKVI